MVDKLNFKMIIISLLLSLVSFLYWFYKTFLEFHFLPIIALKIIHYSLLGRGFNKKLIN